METSTFINNNIKITFNYIKNYLLQNKKIVSFNNHVKKYINDGKILIYTSFILLTNVFTAFYKTSYIYSFLFLFLTMTSILFHANKTNIEGFYLDQLAIYCVVIYGFYLLYSKMIKTKLNVVNCTIILFILITFLLAIYLFYYGMFTKSFCYDENKYIANVFHCLLHFVASLGNHLLIILI